jgi:hypothetical protein
MTFHRDGTVSGAAKSPVTGPFDTPQYGTWQREPGSQNYSFRALSYRYDDNGAFAGLTHEQLDFVETFLRCEGKITRMEEEMALSYPTIRNRLQEVIRALGYEPGREESSDISEEKRRSVLEELDSGKIPPKTPCASCMERRKYAAPDPASKPHSKNIHESVPGDLARGRLGPCRDHGQGSQ